MTDEQQLKLQSFLDGELPEKDARDVAAWLARDADTTALATELRNTRKALANFESDVKLPESREFYWSKIEREIQRREPAAETAAPVPWFALFRRWLMPAGAVAALAAIMFFARMQPGLLGTVHVPDLEKTVADAGAFTYHDDNSGTTLVWVDYPAESEFAKNTVH